MEKTKSTGAQRATLMTLMILMMGVFLVGIVSAGETTYTPTTTTICEGNVCTQTLYSGVQNVYEDNQWKDISKAKSLKGTGAYNIEFLETDSDYPMSVLDYNMTSITLDLDHWSFFNSEVDIRIWEANQTKEDKYTKDVREGKAVDKGLGDSYKERYLKVSHEKEKFNAFNLGDKKVTYTVSPGDIIEFGPNSTTLTLQVANSENLEDTFIYEDAATNNYGATAYGLVGGGPGYNFTTMYKFNISSIPAFSTISEAKLNLYAYGMFLDPGDSLKLGSHHLYDSYDWVETDPTWNTQTTAYNTTEDTETFVSTSAINKWYDISVKEALESQMARPNTDNLSIWLAAEQEVNILESDTVYWRSKEEANPAIRPLLNVTYTLPPPTVNITYPFNATDYGVSVNHFNWSITNYTELDSCAYSLNGAANVTVGCADYNKTITSVEGNNSIIFSATNIGALIGSFRTDYSQDTTAPVVNVTYPFGTITNQTIGHTIYLNWTASDATSDISSCWYNYNNTNTTVTCGDQNTTFTTAVTGQRNITFYANDSFNYVNSYTASWDYKVLEYNRIFNTTSVETTTDYYILNMSSDGTQTTTAQFWYNNTNYTATKVGNNVDMTFTSSISHPWGEVGNQSLYWTIDYGAEKINTTIAHQQIDGMSFGPCNATLVQPFLNFTFKDEVNDTFTNSTFTVLDWYYYTGDGTQNKSFSFTNLTEQESYSFCMNTNMTIHNNATIRYEASGYPQRIYAQSADLSNATTYVTLYLLGTADGQSVSFQTQDQYSQPISGTTVKVEKQFGGAWSLIGEDLSDATGTTTFFLNPDDDHRITATKEGYSSTVSIIRPTQPTYTIILSISGGRTTDYSFEGVNYNTWPESGMFLDPNTTYTFGLNITSNVGNITACKLIITNTSFDSIGSAVGCEGYGGNISVNLNTADNRKLFGNYYLDLGEGYKLVDSSSIWIVESMNTYPGGSLYWELMVSLKNWDGFGTGNAADFNRFTFFFLMIIILVGILTKFTGIELNSPGYTLLIVWAIMGMFSMVGYFKVDGIILNAWLSKHYVFLMASFVTWGYVLNHWRIRTT